MRLARPSGDEPGDEVGWAPSSTTNLQDLAPAEAELVLGGRREVVLRYRLHVLSSETTESTRNDVPLLLEGARGRSLHDAPHSGETQNGVCYVPTRGSALEKRWGSGRGGGRKTREEGRSLSGHARETTCIYFTSPARRDNAKLTRATGYEVSQWERESETSRGATIAHKVIRERYTRDLRCIKRALLRKGNGA